MIRLELNNDFIVGPIVGCLSGIVGCVIAGLFIIWPRGLPDGLRDRAGIAGLIVFLTLWVVGMPLFQRLPGSRDWGRVVYALLMLVLPGATVALWALHGF